MGRASAHIRIGQLAQPGQVPFHQPRSQEKEGGEGKERRGEGRRERRGRGGEGRSKPTAEEALYQPHQWYSTTGIENAWGSPLPEGSMVLHIVQGRRERREKGREPGEEERARRGREREGDGGRH